MRKRHLSDDEINELFVTSAPGKTSPKRARQMEHVESCEACSDRYDQCRKFVSVLGEPAVWFAGRDREPSPRDTQRVERIIALMRQLGQERADVLPLLDQTLAGPRETWMAKLSILGDIYTHGMVDALIDRADGIIRSKPADALELTSIATEIADRIPVDAYAFDFVIALRARACREHAFSLYCAGRMPEAMRYIERGEALFRQTPRPEFDLARLTLMRAIIFRDTDRVDAALPLMREAAAVFRDYGDKPRHITAALSEAILLFKQRRFADALAIWSALENEPSIQQQPTYGLLLQHLGSCHREMNDLSRARGYYARAIAEFQKRNDTTDLLHVRWSLGLTLLAEGKHREALADLRYAWRGLTDIQMPADGALAGLKLAETLLMLDEPAEVPAICRAILDEFTRAGMMTPAVSALSFLREAVAMGKDNATTAAIIRHVHDFLQDLPTHPVRAFTPPAL